MPETGHTTNRAIPYPTGKDFVPEGPAEMQALANAMDAENRGEIDFLQAGVVKSTDWSFNAVMENPATCALESEAAVGGVAWLPLTAIGLVRSVTTPAKLAALKPSSLPGASKYLTVGFELTPSTSDGAATVSVVSGAEQTTRALAEANSPAITAGKARIRDVVILNTAGVYSIASQAERRSQCDLTHRPGDLIFSAAASRFGCLPAEGGSYPRASYPALYAEIGTANGETAGDGLHFNVPDFRGRVPMGAGKGEGGEESEAFPARSLGQKIGAMLHRLTGAQSGMPEHSHAIAPYNDGSGGNPAFSWTIGMNGNPHTPAGTVAAPAQAAAEAHNIVQPSTVCSVWVKF
jgi:microcystin-dependent protein